jgi:protein-S-isoprenylcysteine O-methyltransferase Ste14
MVLLLKNVLFTVLAPGTVAVYLPLLIAGSSLPGPGPAFAVGLFFLAAGAALYVWCVWDFATFGRGTPAPVAPPAKLVIRGPYRFTRNPMYVGMLTVVLGWSILFGAARLLLYALALGSSFHLFIIFYEEPHLRGEFPDEYEAYCSRVPRWLPRPGGRRAP